MNWNRAAPEEKDNCSLVVQIFVESRQSRRVASEIIDDAAASCVEDDLHARMDLFNVE